MSVRCAKVVQALQDLFPPRFAVEGDATGLQVGSLDQDVGRVLCALDLTLAVAEEARDLQADLVVSHHAVIYRPLAELRTDRARGRILATLIQAGVAGAVPHTAFDVADGGLNDHLAEVVGLEATSFLEETGRDELTLQLGRVPGDLDAVERALLFEGASAVSVVGERLEVTAPAPVADEVARRLEFFHGEAPRVIALAAGARRRGIGRIGRLKRPETVGQLAARLKGALGAPGVRVSAPDPDAALETVAVLGGDGRHYVQRAIRAGAEALVTGDVDHHTALEARANGLALIDVGHWASERRAGPLLAELLADRLDAQGVQGVEVRASEVDTNPFAFV